MGKLTEMIPFGEWLPDLPDFQNQGATIARNVLTDGANYKPFKSLQDFSTTVTETVVGAIAVKDSDGDVEIFAGGDTKLFQLNSDTPPGWDDVSRTSGGAYNVPDEGAWEFAQFGERIMATNFTDDVQSFVMGTSTTFTQLDSAAPKASHIAVFNNFVVLANTFDGVDGNRPQRVWWSAINDPTNWPTPGTDAAAAVLSDRQDLAGEGGAIQKIASTQNFTAVIQDRNIVRMQFEGPPTTFSFSVAEKQRGTEIPGSVVQDGKFVYYHGLDGFYAFNGTSSIPIGNNKVNKFFQSQIDDTNLHRVSATVDPINQLIIWAYPGPNNNAGDPNRLLIYNKRDDRWTEAFENLEFLFSGFTTGFTLDQLDQFGTLDTLPASLDSKRWQGGQLLLAAISDTNKLGFFDGINLSARVDGTEVQLNTEGRTRVTSVLPITDATTVQVGLFSRNSQADALGGITGNVLDNVTREFQTRVDAFYHRANVTIAEGQEWESIQGVKFRARASARR